MNIKPKYKIAAILSLTMLLSAGTLFGQRPIDIDEIKVVAPYEPTVSDAFKINDNPRLDDTLTTKPVFAYNVLPRRLTTRFELEPITPARMRGEPLVKLYQGHFRGGFGTYTTPYGEAFYSTLRSNDYSMGVHLKHLSSSGTIKDHGFSGFSDNLAHLYGKRFFGDNTLSGGLRYDRNVIHYYGFRPDDYEGDPVLEPIVDDLTKKDIRQRINQLNTSIGFGSHHPDSSRFGFYAGLEHNWLSDLYDASEHKIGFKGRIGREIQDPTGMADQVYLGMNVKAEMFHNVSAADTSTTGLISFFPSVSATVNGRFRLNAGLDLAFEADTASYFRVYPNLGLEAELLERYLTVHGRFSGGLQRHSLRSLLQENPFLNTQAAPLGFQNTKTQITAGLKGAFTDKISYNFFVSSEAIDNFAFFVTDTANLLPNQFTLAYDNIRRLHVRGELFSQFGSRFNARLATDFFQYSLDEETEAWHLPTLQVGLNLKYNMQDKIIVSADVFARNATFGRTFDELNNPFAMKLHDVFVDGNIGIEYRYTRVLSFFLNFYNVQNKSLERWMNYPTQKFQVMGGVTWSF